ncbi:MAG: CARDB domain-containing protein [Planctomycetota bacterium]
MNARKARRRKQAKKRSQPRRPLKRPLIELLEDRRLLATDLSTVAPAGVIGGTVGQNVRDIDLTFTGPLTAESAREQANYQLLFLGADGVIGGGDDQTVPVVPQHLSGTSEVTLAVATDLSTWGEADYAFPSGIHGDWQPSQTSGGVTQAANGAATFFVSDEPFFGQEFAAQLEVASNFDDDYLGVVFGLTVDEATGYPDSYYLLAWKRGAGGGASQGLTLAKVTGAGASLATRPDLWSLSSSDPRIDVLATQPGMGWDAQTPYEFRVGQQAGGQIDVSVVAGDTGANVWSTQVTDSASPLGAGRVGFYNLSQPDVNHWALRTTGSLEPGAYQVTVFDTLLDAAGDPLANVGVGAFTIDFGTPTVGVDLQTASDTGVSGADDLTNDTTPTFDVQTSNAGVVRVFIDDAAVPATTLVFADAGLQAWTAPVLGEGGRSIRAEFTPDVGNTVQSVIDVEIDTIAPTLEPGQASEQAPLYERTLTFSEPVDAASVLPQTVSGPTTSTGVDSVQGDGDTYTFSFAPRVEAGGHTVSFGQPVSDLAGNTAAVADAFTLIADITAPVVTSVTRTGLIKAPVETITILFDEEVQAASFTPADVLLTGPTGVTLPAVVSVTPTDSTGREFAIQLATPLVFDGDYSVSIGPGILDLSDNPLAAAVTELFTLALPPAVPGTPGEGVFVEVFTGVSGGGAPTPARIDGLSPDGTLVAPAIDFPNPGANVPVGQTLTEFFGGDATPPPAVASSPAANFTLRNTFFVAITEDLDLDPLTPEIDVRLGVSSDDGFHLTVDDQLLGSAGGGSSFSLFDFQAESAGLYPVTLLYAAGTAGASGLEFRWETALTTPANEVVSQQNLYLEAGETVTFEELPPGTVVTDQYQARGVLFNTLSGSLQVTDATPEEFVPVSGANFFADPAASPTELGQVELSFVVPGTDDAATTNFVSFFLLDADGVGSTVTAFDPAGAVVFSQTVQGANASQEQVVIQADQIARVTATLGQGAEAAAIDQLRFNTPTLLNTAPELTPIADVTVDEQSLLQFTVTATDAESLEQTLTFELAPGSPAGASIHPSTGVFTWTPSEAQGPAAYPITVLVRDSGSPRLRDEATFTVTVAETNTAPAIEPIAPQTVTVGTPLEFDVSASDADVPAQALTYSLDPGAPTWASIDPVTGRFAATLTGAEPDGDVPITIRVTDDGAGPLSASTEVVVSVDNQKPDLVATGVATADTLGPGEAFTLTWAIENTGTDTAIGPWTERVFASNSPTPGVDELLLAEFSFTDELAAGGTPLSRSESIVWPATGLVGDVYFWVEVDAFREVSEVGETGAPGEPNDANRFVSAIAYPSPAELLLTPATLTATEGGPALEATVTRNGDTSSPLTVTLTLTPSVADQVQAPLTVTIPTGQFTERFTIGAVADGVFDADAEVTLTASATGFADGVALVTAVNVDQPTLTLTLPATADEDQTVTATVTSDAPAVADTLLMISVTDTNQLTAPTAVLLEEGETVATFDVTPANDALPEVAANYTVSVAAGGFVGDSASLEVPQNDIPLLQLTLPPSVVEGASGPTILGTVTRDVAPDEPLVVELTSSDAGLLTVPATVTIPAGEFAATFLIEAADDGLVNGERPVTVTAQTRTVNGGAVAEGASSAATAVLDNDGPTLTLTTASDVAPEGGGTTAVVTRNTDTSAPLEVSITVSDDGELLAPLTVTIPAGQASSAPFAIAGLEDDISDGDQPVTITASSVGFNSGVASVVVTDLDRPDLVFTSLTAPAGGLTGEAVDVSWEIENAGFASAVGTWVQRVFISSDPTPGGDVLVGQYTFTGPLAEGLSFARTAPVTLPTTPGTYYVIVETDATAVVGEGLETNNLAVSGPITVNAAYTATVSANLVQAPANTPVVLSGVATNVGDGSPAALEQVSVHVQFGGVVRVIPAITDATGAFSTTFTALPGEGGDYDVVATHPGVTLSAAEIAADAGRAEFELIGLRAAPTATSISLTEAGPAVNRTITIENLSDELLTGLAVEVIGAAENLSVTAEPASGATSIAGAGSVGVELSVSATTDAFVRGSFQLRVSTDQAPDVLIPVSFSVTPLRARLSMRAGSGIVSVLEGDQASIDYTITNSGTEGTGELEIVLPAGLPDWVTLAGSPTLPSLEAGEQTAITVLFTPPVSEPFNPLAVNASIGVVGAEVSTSAPLRFQTVSTEVGDLQVSIVDEAFFFTEEMPLVTEATVVLRDAFTGEQLVSSADAAPAAAMGGGGEMTPGPMAVVDPTGRVDFSGIPEGVYTLEAFSPEHDTVRRRVRVAAGEVSEEQLFTSRRVVEYTWRVEPVEVEDRTRVTIEAVFETVVPAPVLVVDGVLDLTDLTVVGQEQTYFVKITNPGFIAVEEVNLNFDPHPFYEFSTDPFLLEPDHFIGTLPAKTELLVPVRVTRVNGEGPAPCSLSAHVEYRYTAGENRVRKAAPIPVIGVEGDCPLPEFPLSLPNGRGGPGGGTLPQLFVQEVIIAPEPPPGPVVAQVRLQIDQTAIQTRDGFRATMELFNESDSPLTNVEVDVQVFNADLTTADAELFGVFDPVVSTGTPLDGTGVLAADSQLSSQWTIIPATEATPTGEPTDYFVGGTLTYVQDGLTFTTSFTPTEITVFPQPELVLDYFLQRDVIGDDPLTNEIEPSEPFTLAVLVQNDGFGDARDLTIESNQPKIVENEKGLLIDFEIIASSVNGQELAQRSLTVTFGDVEPGDVVLGEWLLESTLQGLFEEYEATFEHLSGLGDNRLSLIKEVNIREMIRPVDGGDADGRNDFLVNDVEDTKDLPDTLYFSSDASSVPVTPVDDENPPAETVTLEDLQTTITAALPSTGWGYLRINDPAAGAFELIAVQRQDGSFLPASNFWQTDRTFLGQGKQPQLEDKVHLIDLDSAGEYTLFFSKGDVTGPTVTAFSGVDPNPTTAAIDAITVTFDEAVRDFAPSAVQLLKNGLPIATPGVTVTGTGSQRTIAGLAPFTGDDAVYKLVIDQTAVLDVVNNAGVGDAEFTWVRGAAAPVVLDVVTTPAGRFGTTTPDAVESIDFVFSEVLGGGLTVSAISLTRDGADLLAGTPPATAVPLVGVSPSGAATYRLSGLTGVTSPDGDYAVSIDASVLVDTIGTPGLGTTERTWQVDATPPQLVNLFGPVTNPRNIAVQQIDVEFSEPIDLETLDVTDISLERAGEPGVNLLAGDERVEFEDRGNNVYRIKGITFPQAFVAAPQIDDFTFTFDASGVADEAGNLGVGLESTTWTLDLDKPPAAENLTISTFSGVVDIDEVNSLTATLSGTVEEAGLTVAIRNITTDTELAREFVPGTEFSLPIVFEYAGNHDLRIRTIDPAGNTTDVETEDIVVDVAPPLVETITGLPDATGRVPTDGFDVTFVDPIDPASLGVDDFGLTRDGLPVLLNAGSVTIGPIVGTDNRGFRLAGLTADFSPEGNYQLSIDLTGVDNPAGIAGIETETRSWLLDTTAPQSEVLDLAPVQTTPNFVLQFAGADPRSAGALGGSGISTFDLYVSAGGDPFQLEATLPVSTPTFTFLGEPGVAYAFHTRARDAAGNYEAAPPTPDASTQAVSTATSIVDTAVQLVDGERLTQRSTVNTLTIEFDRELSDAILPPPAAGSGASVDPSFLNAVTLVNLGVTADADDDVAIPLTADQFRYEEFGGGASRIVWSLDAFAGADASLDNGYYVFVLDGDQVLDEFGFAVDGNGNGQAGGGLVIEFHRLFGDVDGDTNVDTDDRDAVDAALGSEPGLQAWNPNADLDLDGQITGNDRFLAAVAESLGVAVSAPTPGDFNGDGTIDIADFTVWRDALGQTGANLAADANYDLVVDVKDYQLWKENFGQVLPAASAQATMVGLAATLAASAEMNDDAPSTLASGSVFADVAPPSESSFQPADLTSPESGQTATNAPDSDRLMWLYLEELPAEDGETAEYARLADESEDETDEEEAVAAVFTEIGGGLLD